MARWEYAVVAWAQGVGETRIVEFSNGTQWEKLKSLPEVLPRLGADGWELVATEGYYWPIAGKGTAMLWFKRPMT